MSCNAGKGAFAFASGKFGACIFCMRQAFLWAAGGWLVWLLLGAFSTIPRAWAAIAAGALTALWAAHVLANGMSRAREAALLARHRGIAGPNSALVAISGWRDALVASLPVFVAQRILGIAQQNPWCNCYFDSDCGFAMFCNWSINCSNQRKGTSNDGVDCPGDIRGSCDGRCRFLRWKEAWDARQKLAAPLDALFAAFAAAARSGTPYGSPSRAELDRIGSELGDECRADLHALAFSALDTVMGWDLVRGAHDPVLVERGYVEAFIGHVPDPRATPEIIEAARSVFRIGLEGGDVAAALAPLAEFWRRFPDYRPAHSGRCYPHGHDRFSTALECQQAQLRKMLEALLVAVSAPGHTT
jgi:hypothetical protein